MCVPNGQVKFGGSKWWSAVRLGSMPSGRSVASDAASATSWIVIDGPGRAGHGERAADELEVRLGGLEQVRGDRAGLGHHLLGRHEHRDPADGEAARAVGVAAERARSPCRRAAPRRRRGARRGRRRRSAPTPSRGPARAGEVPVTTSTLPPIVIRTVAASQPPLCSRTPAATLDGESPPLSVKFPIPMPSCDDVARLAALRAARRAAARSRRAPSPGACSGLVVAGVVHARPTGTVRGSENGG